MKKLLLATLLALTTLTVGATTVKADDMRDYFEADEFGDAFSRGYMTLEDHTKGADFKWGYFNEEGQNEGGYAYFKIIDDKTVKLVADKSSSGECYVNADYIQWDGVKYKNIVIGTDFKNNKKIKSIEFDNANSVVIKSKGAFENSSLRYIKLKGIKEIPANCFKNCQKLGGVTIEDAHKLKTFGKTSFYNCYNLTQVKLESKYFTSCNAIIKYMKKHGKIELKDNVFGFSSRKKLYKLHKMIHIWMYDNTNGDMSIDGYCPQMKYIFKENIKKQQRSCGFVCKENVQTKK